MCGPFLKSLRDKYSAVTVPTPIWRPEKPAVRYIYTNRAGAAPVVMEWHELSTTAQSVPSSTIPACAMDQTTAHKFELMERHHWTKAGNSQMEFEIRK